MSIAIAVIGALIFLGITGFAGFRAGRRAKGDGPTAWSAMGPGRRTVYLVGAAIVAGAIGWSRAFDGPPLAWAVMLIGVGIGLAAVLLGRKEDEPWRGHTSSSSV